MGFSASWLAVRGKPSTAVLSELGLRGTGEYDDVPDSPHLWGTSLPAGWYLVFANRSDYREDFPLDRLSSSAELVACFVEEHVMVCAASGWRDGKEVWSIYHESDQSLEHLETKGDLPPVFTSIRDRLAAQQAEEGGDEADVDYFFDVGVEVAETLTGFRHDEYVPDLKFERLQR
jgi:hypothetical protein